MGAAGQPALVMIGGGASVLEQDERRAGRCSVAAFCPGFAGCLVCRKAMNIQVSIYRFPPDRPEAYGTFHWDSTPMVLVESVAVSGMRGLGYTYTSAAAAEVIRDLLAPVMVGTPVFENGRAWQAMVRSVRNAGLPGIAACAISAVDVALWDLKAKKLDLPLYYLLVGAREARRFMAAVTFIFNTGKIDEKYEAGR